MSLSSIAENLLASYDQVNQVTPEAVPSDLTVDQAKEIVQQIQQLRQKRGEQPIGYKIGFTNRTIWARYGVSHPIWGPVYDSTLTLLENENAGSLNPALFTEPRLEPEIVVCLGHSPADASLEAVAGSIEWIAHGFEIVQSPYPGWQFTGAQSFAAQALHGALLVGPRIDAAKFANSSQLADVLSGLSLSLYKNGNNVPVDSGLGANVLDGPVQALAHLVAAKMAQGETLPAGSIITTGTITDAHALLPGDRWRSELSNAGDLVGLELSVSNG